jgi:hypothetical protein
MSNRYAVFTTLLWAAVLSSTGSLQGQNSEVKNIILVHGAWGGRFRLEGRLRPPCEGWLQRQHRGDVL